MNKKTYQKPEMQVYLLMKHAPLICQSPGGGGGTGGGGGIIYIPRINEDLNKLA
jgi:hypothetical protein